MDYKSQYKYIPPFKFHLLTRIYDSVLVLAGFGKKFRKKIVKAVEVEDSYKILDVGCGTGVFLELLKENYPNILAVGIDPDQQALTRASKRLNKYSDIKLINAFAEALPFNDETFDIVYSTLAFHHIPTKLKEKAITEIYRVLKKEGKLVIVDFGTVKHYWFYRIVMFFERFEYMEDNLKGLLPEFMTRAGFKNINEDSIKFPVIHLLVGSK